MLSIRCSLRFSLCRFLLGFFTGFLSIPENSTLAEEQQWKICHVSSQGLGKLLPRAKDSHLEHSGFRLAIEQYNQSHTQKAYLKIQPTSRNSIDVITGVQLAAQQGCIAIVGLVSSRDALLAGPALAAHHLVGISSTATAESLNRFFPFLLSFAPSQKHQITAIAHHIHLYRQNSSVFLIGKSDDLYSLSFIEEAKKFFPNAPIFSINSQGLLSEAHITAIQEASKPILFYALYPVHSTPSLHQIAENLTKNQKHHTLIIGTTPWLETQIFATQPDIFSKLPEMRILTPWKRSFFNKTHLKRIRFLKDYYFRFGTQPDYDSIYDFDVALFILDCLNQTPYDSKTPLFALREQISQCLSSQKTYRGIAGNYYFTGRHSHPIYHLFPNRYIPSPAFLNLEFK